MSTKPLAVAVALMIASATAVAAWQLPERASEQPREASDSLAPRADVGAAPAKELPAAKGKGVLRVSGVVRGNAGAHTTKVDFATLDELARERVTVYEPFVKRDLTFTGMRMSKLLSVVGVPASASTIYMHALDDYHVDLPLGGVASDGFLATRVGGEPIPIAEGGPVRLVFTGDGNLAANTDNWIWSIDSMRVHG